MHKSKSSPLIRTKVKRGWISGSVFNNDGTPASNYNIALLDTFGFSMDRISTSSSSYTLFVPSPSIYLVVANNRDFYSGTTDPALATRISVAEGQTVSGIDITLSEQSVSDEITIIGRCYEGPGTDIPVNGCIVYFAFVKVETLHGLFLTSWHLVGLPENFYETGTTVPGGNYYIMTSCDGFKDQWWKGDDITNLPIPVTISSDSIYKDIHLSKGGEISGSIKDKHTGIVQSGLSIFLIDSEGYIIKWIAVEKGDTTYSIEGLYPGEYYKMSKRCKEVSVLYSIVSYLFRLSVFGMSVGIEIAEI